MDDDDCALSTWLKDSCTNLGPDCDSSPHSPHILKDVTEVCRLLIECGLEFLPTLSEQEYTDSAFVVKIGLRLSNDICSMLENLEDAHLQAVNVRGKAVWNRGQKDRVPVLHPIPPHPMGCMHTV